LTAHSCEPNIYYKHKEEGNDWRSAFAAKDIKKGDQLSVDFNSAVWDRSEYCNEKGMNMCHCESQKCTGTMNGFKFLSSTDQNERQVMSRRRVPPPYHGEAKVVKLGMALSPHVRECWRKDLSLKGEITPEIV